MRFVIVMVETHVCIVNAYSFNMFFHYDTVI